MSDSTEDKVSTKVSKRLLLELESAAIEARKTLGRKPAYSELIELAWDIYKNSGQPMILSADVKYALALLEWLRSPVVAEMKPFTDFVISEFERQALGKDNPAHEIAPEKRKK